MSTAGQTPSTPAAAGAAATNAGNATGARNNTFTSASLYVGDLAPDVTEAVLFDIFNAVGPVASVRVCRDAQTRRSLGYAYVNFHRVDDAERALDSLNFKAIKNRPCRIMWSHRDPTLRKSGQGNIFVKNLAKSIDHKQLFDTFSMFGNILSCKVATNSKTGESLGYGFVHYESDEAAALAIEKVNKKVIAGEKVIVMPFKSKKDRGGTNKDKFTNVYVKNLPSDYTKDKLIELFSKQGHVNSCMVAAVKETDGKEGKGGAFGFVNFDTHEEAAAAVESFQNYELEGKKLVVCRAQKKEEREKELRERFENLKIDRQKKWAGINLYIKNLGDDVDEEKLREMFAPFGAIQSCHIAREDRDKKSVSRGFGFVCFTAPEEATKAVTEMNGKMIEGKPLYVTLAQRKDVRRNQLEQRFAQRVPKGGPMGPQPPMFPPQMPMFYPQQPRAGPYMYPAQMWRGGPMPGPMMNMRGQPGMNFQLMPVHGGGGRGGQGPAGVPNRGGRGGRGGQHGGRGGQQNQGQGQQGQGQGQQGGPQGANFKYTDNARNRGQGQQAAQGETASEADKPTNQGTSFVQELAQASEPQKKQMIGEQLFPLVKARQAELAPKITGMLLEMDNSDLIHLLESSLALDEKVNEALEVLNSEDTQAQGQW